MTLRIAVDIGGTFTDGIAQRSTDGALLIAKSLTTPDDPGRAVSTVLGDLLQKARATGGTVEEFVHATTLVTNAVIEAGGGRTALIMTAGTADTLLLRREDRYDMYDLDIQFTPPLVPREAIFEVSARMDADGSEVAPVDEDDLTAILDHLADVAPEAVGVCLLHAYANGSHEKAIGAALRDRLPDAKISLSSDVAPEIREYERASTVAANAYVQPLTSDYLAGLVQRLEAEAVAAPLRVMTSGGGFTSNTAAAKYPVRLLESGPAAGVLSAADTGLRNGIDNVLAFDMGGTTAKACVVRSGQPEITSIFEAGRAKRFAKGSGLPIITPSIDLIEIGAGGGSIAHPSALGLLNVGPESASSVPGPACYGLGGTRPTVTDADLLLGNLDKDNFLGGEMTLDKDAAQTAMDGLAAELGADPARMAFGICNLVNENMAAAARVHIAEKGYDPRHFTMVATGGAGPVHAVEVAHKLGLRRVLCSVAVGVGSCLGLLAAPPRVDRAWTRVERVNTVDWPRATAELNRVRREAEAEFASSDTDLSDVRWSLSADMRYCGQADAISVPVPDQALEGTMRGPLMQAFTAEYARLYGAALDGEVEIVTWRLLGQARSRNAVSTDNAKASAAPAPIGERALYLPDTGDFAQVPVYSRYDLGAGQRFAGPAIIQETESTIVVAREAVIDILPDLTVSIDLVAGGAA
ncbi:MAG: hydantoinase/oxoprolinase family protein [Pseudomonadota bacterium]